MQVRAGRKRVVAALSVGAAVFVVLCIAWFLAWQNTGFTWSFPESTGETKVLRVAAMEDNAPYSYTDAQGQPAGFDVELACEIASRLGMEAQVTLGEWDDVYVAAEQGAYDVLMGVTMSDERQAAFELSSITDFDTFAIYATSTAEDPIADGGRLAVIDGGYESDFQVLSTLLPGLSEGQILLCDSYEDCFAAVVDGRAESALVPSRTATALLRDERFAGLSSVRDAVYYCFFCVAAQKGDTALADDVSAALSAMQRDGTLDDVQGHWFSAVMEDYSFSAFVREEAVGLAGLFLLLLLCVMAYLLSSLAASTRAAKREREREARQRGELERAYEQARVANEAKTNFLSSMSHDIRTPINAIAGLVEIAQMHEDDPKRLQDVLREIETSSDRLLSLVNDVLDISAIEGGKIEMRLSKHNILASFNQYEGMFRSQMVAKSLAAEFTVHDIQSPWVMADDTRVHQIFNNLISNAVKYTPEGGKVFFDAYQELGENGRLMTVGVVRDTGIGMTSEYMQQMWGSFSRGTDTRVNTVQGSGLGLAIVKDLVERMGGTIAASSEVGRGSTFVVRLPLEPTDPPHRQPRPQAAAGAERGLHVLYAEDNDLNWEIAKELLQAKGVSADRAENGAVCLEMFSQAPAGTWDAILMDMQMPVMGGIEATRRIRALDREDAKAVPIVAVTANAFAEDVQACLDAGTNEHISKPIDMDRLMSVLQDLVAAG